MSANSEKDDFWDIDKLLPRQRRATMAPFATDTPVVTYAPDEAKRADERKEAERQLTITHCRGAEPSEEHTYYPSGMGLIKRVTVRKFIDKYDFYDSFRKSALLYYDCPGSPCDFAQFYSYMPQYAHLTASQKSYYLYWRSELRRGRYIKTDYSYIYLFVYEVLNLPDRIPPEEGIRLLCAVWREYRGQLPRIDMYFSIWVQDYCLVHRLPPPIEYTGDFLFDCIGIAPLKEFYLADIREVGLSGIDALLAYLSDYDWKRGKYAGDVGGISGAVITTEEYKKHMTRAMYLLLSEVWGGVMASEEQYATLVRDAFPNSLCTHSVKCKLEIEYISLAKAESLRAGITSAVRYTENKLRALLGVKSRLNIKDLPETYKRVIDSYFGEYVRAEQRRRAEANRPEYEKLYEAATSGISFESADEIERISWINTARLVVEDEMDTPTTPISSITPEQEIETHTDERDKDVFGLSDEAVSYLCSLLNGVPFEPKQIPTDTLAEMINDAFAEGFGDIILEPDGAGYAIIDDYREDVEVICKHLK